MRQTILRWAWRALKPILLEWLHNRALRLPAHQRDALAQRLGAPPHTVEQIETTLRQLTLYQLERWNP
ncbi:MAG: hypothetical protein KatS3mg020_0393 [Fimbriimonadales bacterium]|nr:MAG: hypothetical protein KatS3mg019_2028 [Fimbriimonadales bacterium]GIV10902.1 MAG: hypothetical protein KatS3mg020_0393 [Fimbriimonadales bacterium]